MGVRVCYAVEVSDPAIGPFALPAGFPIVVSESDHLSEPIEPINSYLYCTFAPVGEKPLPAASYVAHSAIAVAFDLRDWWEFLQVEGLSWKYARQQDLEKYRDILKCTHSPSTARQYAVATIRRRMLSVIKLYEWAKPLGLVEFVLDRLVEEVSPPPQDEVMLAHISSGSRERHGIFPTNSRSRWDNVFAFDKEGYQKLTQLIGPLPSKAGKRGDPHFRIACEFAIQTGVRVSEATAITMNQISDMLPAAGPPMREHYLLITHTKGRKARNIMIPDWLLKEIEIYIARFRSTAISRLVRNGGRPHDLLFVYGPTAGNREGVPQKAKTLSARFSRAVALAGFTKRINKRDPVTGELFEASVPAYWFHCLRHTFVIWTADASFQQGKPPPWKWLQAALGHASQSTTTDLYGKMVGQLERTVSDKMQAQAREYRRRKNHR